MSTRLTGFKRRLLPVVLLLSGLYCCGISLKGLGQTAVFLHESTTVKARVTDMVQYPFESYTQALRHGNLPWDGDIAYRATVSFTLPTTPVPIDIKHLQLQDLDNCDYRIGQEVDVIVPLTDPARAHLYRWKFLWGAHCLLLLLGLLLTGSAYFLLRRRRKRKTTAAKSPAPSPDKSPAQAPAPSPAHPPVKSADRAAKAGKATRTGRTTKPTQEADNAAPRPQRKRKKSATSKTRKKPAKTKE